MRSTIAFKLSQESDTSALNSSSRPSGAKCVCHHRDATKTNVEEFQNYPVLYNVTRYTFTYADISLHDAEFKKIFHGLLGVIGGTSSSRPNKHKWIVWGNVGFDVVNGPPAKF